MASAPETNGSLPTHLSVWDAVSIMIGIVVGTGIFETPPFIFSLLGGWWTVMGVWVGAGLLCLVGALCYAELGTTYPHAGGDYVYLTRAYGRGTGFLFAWAQLAVILTANIGMMTYVFAQYATRLFWDTEKAAREHYQSYGWLWAAMPVVLLTLLNILGVRAGKVTQNLLTVVKILGLSAIILAGLFWPAEAEAASSVSATTTPNLAFALVLVFLTYGGWNDAAYVAAEVRDGARGIPRALILGILTIMGLYILVNFAYLNALGYAAAEKSNAIAAAVLERPLGKWGEKAMCVLVMLSALGAANGLIFTGARVSLSMGREHAIFAWLGHWHARRGAPYVALLTQALICLLMILVVGTTFGQTGMNQLFASVGLPVVKWEGRSGFETLLQCTAPIFWIFFLLTGISLFVLRFKDWDRPRPFTVPLYPVLPAIFCATCGYMVYSGIGYAGTLGWVGAALLAVGVPVYVLSRLVQGNPPTVALAPTLPAANTSSDHIQAAPDGIKPDARSITRRD